MALYPLKADTEFKGNWFLPAPGGEPVVISAGTLHWTDRRAELSLNGSFGVTAGPVFSTGDLKTFPVIHGATTASVPVTLLNSVSRGRTLSFGPLGAQESERVLTHTCVIGHHVDTETRYTRLEARVPGLEHWLDMPIVTTQWPTPPAGEPERVIYTATKVPRQACRIDKHAVTFRFGTSFVAAMGTPMNISVNGYGAIEIVPDEPQPMEWLLERLGQALALLSLLSGSPMAAGSLQAMLPDQRDAVSWLVRTGNHELSPVTQKGDFFMTRTAMGISLGDAMTRWFDGYDKVATPSQLALSVINTSGLWPHVEFLSYMQALEGLHRADSSGLYTSIEEYKEIETALVKAIPPATDQDHRASLKSRIRYGNEISLRKRLAELIAPLDGDVRQRIFGPGGKLPTIWIDARNYYTHWDETSDGKGLDAQAMSWANTRMRTLLRTLYLLRVGVPTSAILRALDNACMESQTLAGIAAAEHRQANPGSQAGALFTIERRTNANVASVSAPSANASPGSATTGTEESAQ